MVATKKEETLKGKNDIIETQAEALRQAAEREQQLRAQLNESGIRLNVMRDRWVEEVNKGNDILAELELTRQRCAQIEQQLGELTEKGTVQ